MSLLPGSLPLLSATILGWLSLLCSPWHPLGSFTFCPLIACLILLNKWPISSMRAGLVFIFVTTIAPEPGTVLDECVRNDWMRKEKLLGVLRNRGTCCLGFPTLAVNTAFLLLIIFIAPDDPALLEARRHSQISCCTLITCPTFA